MATKCTIIGDQPQETKKKPIEFVKWIDRDIDDVSVEETTNQPNQFHNIELICRSIGGRYDIMFAYFDDARSTGCLYLGHWNDGFVEE